MEVRQKMAGQDRKWQEKGRKGGVPSAGWTGGAASHEHFGSDNV